MTHPLQAMRPVPLAGGALEFEVLGQLQADLDGRGRKGGDDQSGNKVIHRLGAHVPEQQQACTPDALRCSAEPRSTISQI